MLQDKPKTLRDYRGAAKLTQAQLARLAGVAQTLVSAIERGKVADPKGRSLNGLCRALNVGRDELEAAVRASVLAA
jgi:transcriptional regulator with XRE-family HTH domain